MKRFIAKVLTAALLLSILTLPLTSCSGIKSSLTGIKDSLMIRGLEGEEKAAYLMELSDRRLAEADSYKLVQNTHIKFEIEDVSFEEMNEVTITCVDDGETYFHAEDSKSDVWVGTEEKTTWYQDIGYSEGEMFVQYRSDSSKNRLKSPISAEDFKAWLAHRSDSLPAVTVTEEVFCTISCEEAENGGWTVTYEDFTEEGLKPFLYMIRGIDRALTAEYDITDVRMTTTLDADYYPSAVTMAFEFTAIGNPSSPMPVLTVEAAYGSWNSVTEEEATRRLGAYDEIDDVRFLENFLTALNARKTADKGAFTATSVGNTDYGGDEYRTELSQEVTFRNGEDYSFTLNYTQYARIYDIVYKNGKMTTRETDQNTGQVWSNKTQEVSRGAAQLTVNQLMDPETVSGIDFESATCVNEKEGIYRFDLGPVARKQLKEKLGTTFDGTIDKLKGYVEATIVDGMLLSYVYHVDVNLSIKLAYNASIRGYFTSEITVTFHDATDTENNSESTVI